MTALLLAKAWEGRRASTERGHAPDANPRATPLLLAPDDVVVLDDANPPTPGQIGCRSTILDIVSRKWITTVCSIEESSTQVELAFTHALETEGLWAAADEAATDTLVKALVDGEQDLIDKAIEEGERPLLLAISDNGPQMRSHSTKEFLAGAAIARQFGRPGVPQDQAWIETLFGHVKDEWPDLEHIPDGVELEAELALVQEHYNTVRLSAAIGYVTPHEEHEGLGEVIRQARRDGLTQARLERIEYRRTHKETQP